MRKGLTFALSLLVAASLGAPSAWGQTVGAEFSTIFAGGGSPYTNGIFFPGTAICGDDETCTPIGVIPQITKGTDITFTNLDEGAVANAHRIVCLDKTKKGRPKCVSDQLDSPGDSTVMSTSRLKPAEYYYYCSVHTGMYGVFEVIKP
jgi:hypothetical protein